MSGLAFPYSFALPERARPPMELIKENELESLDLSGGPWREEAVLTDQTKRERAKKKAK